nr:reverse transcriptase domain-containing protein [Rickettsia endosymbiont of Ceutorhynchus assimilis]
MVSQVRETGTEEQQIPTVKSKVSKLAGRLRHFYPAWSHLTKDKHVLSWIRGIKIPFAQPPLQVSAPRGPKWSLREQEQIRESINELLQKGAINKVEPCKGQFVSKIFLTPKPDGSQRFILNLKYLNNYINTGHFKLEDHKTVIKLIYKNCFMATLDLKDAYFLLSVNKTHRKYLRFQFNNSLYEFTCMPFGLNCAPLIFTKLMKPILSFLRKKGLISVLYLDDFLLLGNTFSDCEVNVQETVRLLENLGFIINFSKSSPSPQQTCTFLGFTYNSLNMKICLPELKKQKIIKLATKFFKCEKCRIREFAQFIGVLTSACPAVKYGWLYTKNFERVKAIALKTSRGDFDSFMDIPSEVSEDFLWWIKNSMKSFNNLPSKDFKLSIFSDASTSGWGSYCEEKRAHGFWNRDELREHINYLELLAAFFAIRCFASNLSHSNILCRIDNTTAIACINRMGSVRYPKLNSLARKFWQWCEKRKILVYASYIKSQDNVEADEESRQLEIETEWELNNKAFREVTLQFNSPEIDLFASRVNKKCKRFISWQRDPDSYAVDAFTINWSTFYFYAFPPFSIILQCLHKIIEDKAEGIFVVPYWTSQPWFPVFSSLLVSRLIYFTPSEDLLLSFDRTPHPLWERITLVAGVLSGERCR